MAGLLGGLRSRFADAVESVTGAGRLHSFPSDRGMLNVREDYQPLAHLGKRVLRARRDDDSAEEFDLRMLRVGALDGGLVMLRALEGVHREATLMTKHTPHDHAVRCHSALIENVGKEHCRLLLCDPCMGDLSEHLASRRGVLEPRAAAEVAQQLAFGLGHLHLVNVLFGELKPSGVLRGTDGFWKLGDYGSAAELPISAAHWLAERRPETASRLEDLPPEIRGDPHRSLSGLTDVWFLAALLATMALHGVVAEGARDAAAASVHMGASMLVVPSTSLLDPLIANLWVLLHWLTTADPDERPNVGGTAAMLGTLQHTPAKELLEEMPDASRARVLSTASAAARELAMNNAAASSPDARGRSTLIDRFASAPLVELREVLNDQGLFDFDVLCRNCGMDLTDPDFS